MPWMRAEWGYGVWISEVMLQQTQVCSVLPRFTTFIQEFPTISDLAGAKLEKVLAQWSGLGYYARARNLHRAANEIVEKHQGVFPTQWADVIALPGIGRTTAGAILSLAFRQRYPILDGNVKRVLMRVFQNCFSSSIKASDLWSLAERVLPEEATQINHYNQGLMDLGALICLPRNPKCLSCPLRLSCDFQKDPASNVFTERSPKKERKKIHLIAHILMDEQGVYLSSVPEALKIWRGLYFFPITMISDPEGAFSFEKYCSKKIERTLLVKHLCTHIALTVHVAIYEKFQQSEKILVQSVIKEGGRWYSFAELKNIGLPSLVSKILSMLGHSFGSHSKGE